MRPRWVFAGATLGDRCFQCSRDERGEGKGFNWKVLGSLPSSSFVVRKENATGKLVWVCMDTGSAEACSNYGVGRSPVFTAPARRATKIETRPHRALAALRMAER